MDDNRIYKIKHTLQLQINDGIINLQFNKLAMVIKERKSHSELSDPLRGHPKQT